MILFAIINILLGIMIYKVSANVSEKKNGKMVGYLIFNSFIILSLTLWFFLIMYVIYSDGGRVVDTIEFRW